MSDVITSLKEDLSNFLDQHSPEIETALEDSAKLANSTLARTVLSLANVPQPLLDGVESLLQNAEAHFADLHQQLAAAQPQPAPEGEPPVA